MTTQGITQEILVTCQLCGTPQIVDAELLSPTTKRRFRCIGCEYGLCTAIPQDNSPLHQFLLLKMANDLPMAVAFRANQLELEGIPFKLQTLCDRFQVSMFTVTRVRGELKTLKEKLAN